VPLDPLSLEGEGWGEGGKFIDYVEDRFLFLVFLI